MTARIAVLVPSRGRPGNVAALRELWAQTSHGLADLVVAVDDDDPARGLYEAQRGTTVVGPRLRLGGTLNALAPGLAESYDTVGFMGDDHRPRTPGWDVEVMAALDRLGSGFVYGNDLIQQENLPTAVFVTSDIVRTLGWMCPPGLVHLELDSAWLALGRALGKIAYLPDVVIEHMHPIAGRVEWDAGYIEVNSGAMQAADRARFEEWVSTEMVGDVERLRRGIPALR